MNERIKELSKQAWESITVQDALADEAFDQFDQKFAELIVRECAELNFRELGLSGSSSFDVGRMIKQHFGVEN